ncbi:MAG: cell division protein ZapD [Candidatus Symbiodolus clandestinus]
MKQASSTTIFEYPLNEKIRMGLRLEYLLQHLFSPNPCTTDSQLLFFLQTLSVLLDILERYDARSDLLKALESQQQKLSHWSRQPGVDLSRLEQWQQQLSDSHNKLLAEARLGQILRDDPLLSAVRQRLLLPSNSYPFDLPLLHGWLQQPTTQHNQQITTWLKFLKPLQQPLQLHLTLLRQTVTFVQHQAVQGFYKGRTDNGFLLRLQIAKHLKLYPQISAHKNYFVISFFTEIDRAEKLPEQFFFGLACI